MTIRCAASLHCHATTLATHDGDGWTTDAIGLPRCPGCSTSTVVATTGEPLDACDLGYLDGLYSARSANDRDAIEHDASLSTRDDGFLMHGRLPCEDRDAFNPCIVAHAPSKPADPRPLLPAMHPRARLVLIRGVSERASAESGEYATAVQS